MPIYRLNNSGALKKITGLYRLNNSGVLKKVSTAWRLNDAGVLKRIFASLVIPNVKTNTRPLLYFRSPNGSETASSEIFSATASNLTSPAAYDGDKLFLIRGNWNEEPLDFDMKIQKSQSSGFTSGVSLVNASSSVLKEFLAYSDDDYAYEIPVSSSNRYTITKPDVRDGFYFRGFIEATNNLDRMGEYSTEVVLPRMFATVSFSSVLTPPGYVSDPQPTGGTFSWSYSGRSSVVAADIYTQEFLVYPLNNTSGTPLYSTTIAPGTSTTVAPTSIVTFTSNNLAADTEYTIIIKTTMNDGWKTNATTALRTIITDQKSFKTSAARPATPTNVVATDVGTNRPYNNGAVSLSWTQPNNGTPAVGYKIEYSTGPSYAFYTVLVANTGTSATSGTFTGLSANTNYKFSVTAIGSTDTSDPSADSNAVLITTVPNVPTGISAVAGDAQAAVSFTPPNLTGGKALSAYRATSTPGSLTGFNNFSPVEVTGLTNYTSYTFTVAAGNANGYSAESVSSLAVTPKLPAPVGSGTVTIASDSNSNYIYKITSYGTWSNSATSYDYAWQTSSDGGSSWTTRSSGTSATTIPNYNASAYKGAANIRLLVYGRNQTGPAISPLTSNSLFVFYTAPVITSLSSTGGAGLLYWSFSYTADDPTIDIDLEYKLSTSSTWTLIPVTTTSGQEIVPPGTYDFRVFITNSVQGGLRSTFQTVTGVVVTAAPTASNFGRTDSTATPSQPSTITFSTSNNQVTSSWTNGSPITSVRFKGLGAGVNTEYVDATSPFITSDVSAFTSSASYTATVTNYNNNLQVTASWSQSNSQSYQVNYTSSTQGSDSTAIINNSSSSVSHPINWSTGAGSFTFVSVTLYSGLNGTGTSNTFSTGLSAITPSEKSSVRTNTTSLTWTPPPALPTPTFGAVTRAVGGFSVSISNYDANNFYTVSASAGTSSRSGATITVTGLSAGASSTVSVVASRSGYSNSATGQVTGTAASAPSAPQSLSRGLGGGLSKSFTWSAPSDNGGSAITSYQYSVDGGVSWLPTDSSTSQSYTYSVGGAVSFRVRAVNGVSGGTAAALSFTIPTATTPTASSITSSGATVSWTSTGQSSYSLSGVGPNSPYTGTTSTSVSVTGLSAATTYSPVVTVTSSTSDTFTSGTGSFSTTGGNVAPSGGTYTFSPANPPASGAVSLTITNVSGTPSTFTYSFVWARSSTSSQASSYTNVKTTTNSSSNIDSISLSSTYNNRWVRVQTTVSNGVSPNLTSTQYVFVTDAQG